MHCSKISIVINKNPYMYNISMVFKNIVQHKIRRQILHEGITFDNDKLHT